MTDDQAEKLPPHQTPLWSGVITGFILLVGTSVWGWIQSVLKGVPPGWIALVVGIVAAAALIVFVKPVRSWTLDATRYAWSLRPITRRRADRLTEQQSGQQAYKVAVADQDLIKTQDEVIDDRRARTSARPGRGGAGQGEAQRLPLRD